MIVNGETQVKFLSAIQMLLALWKANGGTCGGQVYDPAATVPGWVRAWYPVQHLRFGSGWIIACLCIRDMRRYDLCFMSWDGNKHRDARCRSRIDRAALQVDNTLGNLSACLGVCIASTGPLAALLKEPCFRKVAFVLTSLFVRGSVCVHDDLMIHTVR